MSSVSVTMPRWPAYLMGAFTIACAVPAMTSPAPQPEPRAYRAAGQEPAWRLAIAGGRIDFVGGQGSARIRAASPDPRPTANGRRYVADRLIVNIVHGRCNDARSGEGYAHRVTVTADGKTMHGCGGQRRRGWDI